MSKKPNEANLVLEMHLRELGWYFEPEYQFCPGRKWRADYALQRLNKANNAYTYVLVEIEGAVFANGHHNRGVGYAKDLEKYRMAAALGYKVFRFHTREVLDGPAKAFLEKWA